MKEARALAQLRHPNIIQVTRQCLGLDVFVTVLFVSLGSKLFGVCTSGGLALVMELADGGTLRDELDQALRHPACFLGIFKFGGELPGWRKFEILHQIVLAMRMIHAKGALHQDIKPSNCMVQVKRMLAAYC